MNVRKQAELDSLKRFLVISPAEKIIMSLQLSNLCYELQQATKKIKKDEKFRTRTTKVH